MVFKKSRTRLWVSDMESGWLRYNVQYRAIPLLHESEEVVVCERLLLRFCRLAHLWWRQRARSNIADGRERGSHTSNYLLGHDHNVPLRLFMYPDIEYWIRFVVNEYQIFVAYRSSHNLITWSKLIMSKKTSDEIMRLAWFMRAATCNKTKTLPKL